MNTEQKINKILNNTDEVKVMFEEKNIKEKKINTTQQKAQDKFTRVGTKLNEKDMLVFNQKIKSEGLNQSQYIKKLLNADLDVDLLKKENLSLRKKLYFYKNRSLLERLKDLVR